jgi:hypothetical protein
VGESDSQRNVRPLVTLPSPAIKTGGALNHLRVEVRGRSVKLVVNGQDVQTVNNGSIDGGPVVLGFLLRGVPPGMAASTRDARIFFDNVVVAPLP